MATTTQAPKPNVRLSAFNAPNVNPVPNGMAPLSATAGGPPVGMPPAAAPGTMGGGQSAGPISTWGGNNTLVGSQVNPVNRADTETARGMMLPALQSLQTAPDRSQLALDALKLFDDQTEAGYQQRLRGVGQQAAKLGRVGSGMTTSELNDVFVARERDRDAVKRGLANDAASQTLSDRLATLGAIGGVQGQLAGQDTAARQEVRGERDYQFGVTRDDRDFAYGADRDADQFWLQTLQTLAPYAYGGNPSGTQLAASAGQSQQAGQSAQNVWTLIEEALRRRRGSES